MHVLQNAEKVELKTLERRTKALLWGKMGFIPYPPSHHFFQVITPAGVSSPQRIPKPAGAKKMIAPFVYLQWNNADSRYA